MSRAGGCPEQARGRVLPPSLKGRVLLTQLTKHDLLEKGQKEGRGTAGLAAGVTSIAVAKEDVARMWRGRELRRFKAPALACPPPRPSPARAPRAWGGSPHPARG